MREICPTRKFDRDLKRAVKRKKDLSKLRKAVDILAKEKRLPAVYKPHPLIGHWVPCWDCHIEPDWLLIYQTTATHVYLFRTGTHADLFE